MKNLDISKIFFYAIIFIIVLGISFGYGLYSGTSKNSTLKFVQKIKADVKTVLIEAPVISKSRPKYFLQPARYDGSGVTVNKADNDDLVFLSGFFKDNNELRLIRRNGDIVARWPVRFSEIFPDTSHLRDIPSTDWNIDIHGAVALPDGSIVFNFEYSGLVKIGRCGDVLWTHAARTHHSVEVAEDGAFWVPGRHYYGAEQDSPLHPFVTPFRESTIMKISSDGALISEFSVPKLFYDSGLEALLTSTGESIGPLSEWDKEVVHLNKIAELKSDIADDFPLFDAGDLMLSLRKKNIILVVDPDKAIIKWWKIGPWKRQHDPEFISGGKVIVFNNNTYRTVLGTNTHITELDVPRISNIVELDPVTNEHRVIYGGGNDQELLSVLRGKVEYMQHGGLLITESEGGRILETDGDGQIIWEYINRYSEDEVAELTEARVYPANYFNVNDWSCGASNNETSN